MARLRNPAAIFSLYSAPFGRCALPSLRSGRGAACSAVLISLLLVLSGCLPYSCRRTESTRLFPADSLSRQTAETVPADTLRAEWTVTGTGDEHFGFPRTVRFAEGDTIYVGDAERNSVFIVDDGEIAREIVLEGVEAPYLAGLRHDTVSIFSPASLSFYHLHDGRITDSTSIQDTGRKETSLVYGAAGERLYYKRLDSEDDGFIASFTRDGAPIDTTWLPGPHWRRSGLMKLWGDTLVSLSGFRPVVDFIPTDDIERSVDTLALVGFDSPMLARSRSFMLGETHEAPLLSSSAAAVGDRLFVLNMRAGWLQVDVFGRDGMLQRRLVQEDTDYRSAFFPQDIDVRRTDSGYDIAVVFSQPEAALKLFRWIPDTTSSSSQAQ